MLNPVADKSRIIHRSKQALLHDNWVILDTETTGLDEKAEICQIGIIDHAGHILINSYVKPSIKIQPGASAIHHITDEIVKNAPTFSQLYARIAAILKGKYIFIYNANFDKRVLEWCCEKDSLPSLFAHRPECLMKWYSIFKGEIKNGSYKWQKLPAGDHSVIGDCRATLRLLHVMAAGG